MLEGLPKDLGAQDLCQRLGCQQQRLVQWGKSVRVGLSNMRDTWKGWI